MAKQESKRKVEVAVADATEQNQILQNLLKTKKELLVDQILQYAMLGEQVKALQARQKIVRPHIENAFESEGKIDPKGHIHLCQVDIDGVEAIKQRRAKIAFSPMVAEQILKDIGMWEQCVDVEEVTITREALNTDKIEDAFEAGLIPKELFDSMFVEEISYALTTQVDEDRNPDFASLKSLRKAYENEAKREAAKFTEVECD